MNVSTLLLRSTPLIWLVACDSQVPWNYDGAALFQLQGSVVNTDADLGPNPQAAILWVSGSHDVSVLSPVAVRGDFPAKFVLTAHEPPPDTALTALAPLGIPALFGTGQIVAADPDSAPFYPKVIAEDLEGRVDDPVITVAPGETLIEHSDNTWFRGGAPAHLLVYLRGEVPAEARCLADYRQGFNLLELTERTDPEWQAYRECSERADAEALREFNAAHGTDYQSEETWYDTPDAEAIQRAQNGAFCNLGCELFKNKTRHVADGEDVVLRMQRDLEFVDWN